MLLALLPIKGKNENYMNCGKLARISENTSLNIAKIFRLCMYNYAIVNIILIAQIIEY